jgi:hypothetical protein
VPVDLARRVSALVLDGGCRVDFLDQRALARNPDDSEDDSGADDSPNCRGSPAG